MSENDKPFSISDRRHFTPEGRPREEKPEPEAQAPGSAAPAEPPAGPAASVTGEAPPAAESAERSRPQRPVAPAGPVDFGAFVLSLGAQAGLLLSGGGEEAGGEAGEEDAAAALEGARQIIGILEMLQDKTQGRRTEHETRVLEDLLFQLRLAYVERSRAAKP